MERTRIGAQPEGDFGWNGRGAVHGPKGRMRDSVGQRPRRTTQVNIAVGTLGRYGDHGHPVNRRRGASSVNGVAAMLSPWVIEEMGSSELNDKRLNDRLQTIVDQLGGHPSKSIPAACGGHAETTAAYRFFDNDKVDFEAILQPHIHKTIERMAAQPVVIVAQDTTEVDLTRPEEQVQGAGLLDGNARYGAFLHPLVAFTPDGTPMGTVYAEVWARDDVPPESKTKEERDKKRKHTPIEEKESVRWVDTFKAARDVASDVPETQCVHVADSEADIYELLEESQKEPQKLDWIIRACRERALQKGEKSATSEHLRERVLAQQVLFSHTITVRGRKAKVSCEKRGRRQPRQSRTAEVEVRAASVTLRAPPRHDRKLTDISINVVLVTERNPRKNDVPVEWILLTSLPIDDEEHVRKIIQYYCTRWMIEVFFRTLKSGCQVEDRQFEHIVRVLNCLAVYMVITWRTLFVCRLGREFPEISCEAVFEPDEWKSVYRVVRNEWPPSTPPTIREMVRLVAQLGGYVNRPRKDEPGPQTVWIGLQRLHDIARCWRIFGPDTRNEQELV